LAAGLCLNPLGDLTVLPQIPLAGFRGDGREGRVEMEKGGMGRGEIGPPTFWLLPPPMCPGFVYSYTPDVFPF